MKNRQADFHFPVEINVYKDGQTEEVTEDLANPAYSYAGEIKRKVFVALSISEYEEYMSKKGLDRQLFLRDKALSLIQK